LLAALITWSVPGPTGVGSRLGMVCFETASWVGKKLPVDHQVVLSRLRRRPASAQQALGERHPGPQDGFVVREGVGVLGEPLAVAQR